MAMVSPELYNKSNSITIVSTEKLIKKYCYLIDWKNNPSVLDIGVGDGNCSKICLKPILPQDITEYIALDISETMLNFAKSNIDIPKRKFIQCDIGSENIDVNLLERFDNVFSFYCIHMIHNTRQAVKNIYNMLKPGGQMLLHVMEYSVLDEAFDKLNKQTKWKKLGNRKTVSPFYYSESPRDEYKKIINEAGFKNYIFHTELVDYDFSQEDEWEKFCISINPLLPKVPSEDVEEYKRDFLDQLRKSSVFSFGEKDENPVINTKYNVFIIVATK